MKRTHTLLAAIAATAMTATVAFAGGHAKDIVDTAAANEDFETLVAAVQAAGLVDTLKGEGPFTVFAPTDAAFEALGDTVATLLEEENRDALVAVLTYHVVPGKVMAADLTDDAMVATVQGQDVTIDLDDGPKINGVNIVATDIETTNGVIHVIDAVIVPEGIM